MVHAIFILVAALTLWGDYKAWRRWGSGRITTATLLILNALPLLMMLVMFIAKDNTQPLMSFSSWMLTLYTVATIARLALYFGWLVCRRVWLGVVLCACAIAILSNGIINTRSKLVVKNITVTDNRVPASFDGFRIAFFSDLHIGSLVSPEREISTLVDSINNQHADIVIFGGDLINIRANELTDNILPHLARIRSEHGIFAVLGNHDTGTYIKDSLTTTTDTTKRLICDTFDRIGWTLLRDSTVFVNRCGESIALTGVDFNDELLEYKHSFAAPESFSTLSELAELPDTLYNIALSHLPQLWGAISAGNFAELTLSGHTHATQIALDIFGIRLSPAMVMHSHWSGLYDDGQSKLYITDGIGCVGFNMRLGANPELTVLELKK